MYFYFKIINKNIEYFLYKIKKNKRIIGKIERRIRIKVRKITRLIRKCV